MIRINLTVITPSLIAFLFRITIPIGFRMNFFGMAVELKSSYSEIVATIRCYNPNVCLYVSPVFCLCICIACMHICNNKCACVCVLVYLVNVKPEKEPKFLQHTLDLLMFVLFRFYVCVCVCVYWFLSHFICCEALLNCVGSDKKYANYMYIFCMVSHLLSPNYLLLLGHSLILSVTLEQAQEIKKNPTEMKRFEKNEKPKSKLLLLVASIVYVDWRWYRGFN